MKIGMLWLDDDKRTTVSAKILRGAEYYRAKYDAPTTEVHVHPETLGETPPALLGLVVRSNPTILRDHFWFGCAEEALHA